MASSKYKLGLVNVKLGTIETDGGMSQALVAVGDTVAGTAVLVTEEAQMTDFKIEESDSPVMSIKTEADTMTLSWSTYNNNADTLIKLFGGTKTAAGGGVGELWNAPDSIPEIEKSIELQWKQGGFIRIARAKITGALNMSFKRDTLSQIDITAKVLQPTKVNEPRIVIEDTV